MINHDAEQNLHRPEKDSRKRTMNISKVEFSSASIPVIAEF